MSFRLTPISMTLDDLDLPQGRILSEFSGISQIWESTTAKQMKIDPYRQRQRCNPCECTFPVPCVDLPYFFVRGLHTRTAVARLP